MSEPTGVERLQEAFGSGETEVAAPTVPEVINTPEPTPVTQTGNPSWNDVLSNIPEVLHEQIKPKLEAWDRGVQQQFEKYKPYEEFLQVDPGQLKASRQLYDTLNQDPVRLYNQLQQFLQDQGQLERPVADQNEVDLSSDENEEYEDPRLAQIAQTQQQMMEYMQAQQNEKIAHEAELWMNRQQEEIGAAFKTKGIEPDWNMILSQAAGLSGAGVAPPDALKQAADTFEAFVNKYRPSANSSAPLLMPPGSSSPATPAIDVTKMADKDRKTLGTQLLGQLFNN